MGIRKIREASVEVLHITKDDTYYLKIDNYTTYTKQKVMMAFGLSLIQIEKDKADDIIKELELVAVEREDKSATNWRGKLWHKMMKYRKSRLETINKLKS